MTAHDEPEEHYNTEDAIAIGAHIYAMATGKPSDDRYRLWDDLSYHVQRAYGDGGGVSVSMFREGIEDLSVYKNLLDNPVAGPLLAYIVRAITSFDHGEPGEQQTTAKRRAALADAFFLTGKKGERWMPMDDRFGLTMVFWSEVRKVLAHEPGAPSDFSKKSIEKAKSTALQSIYRLHYSEDYVAVNDTHKKRMAELRKIVRETPPLNFEVG